MSEEKKMSLADAIALGSTKMKPMGGTYHTPRWARGCAIGMAMFAKGKIDLGRLIREYPVLNETPAELPTPEHRVFAKWPFLNLITHEFDMRVAREPGEEPDITFEQFLEWVATTEKQLNERRAARQPKTKAPKAKPTKKVASTQKGLVRLSAGALNISQS